MQTFIRNRTTKHGKDARAVVGVDFRSDSRSAQGIYIVTTQDDWPCKIGISGNLVERMASLQSGNWHSLRPIYFAFPHKSGLGGSKMQGYNAIRRAATSLEALLHSKLSELVDRLNGEWFDISADDALAAVQKIAALEGYKLAEFRQVLTLDPDKIISHEERAALHDMLLVAGTAEAAIISSALTP